MQNNSFCHINYTKLLGTNHSRTTQTVHMNRYKITIILVHLYLRRDSECVKYISQAYDLLTSRYNHTC